MMSVHAAQLHHEREHDAGRAFSVERSHTGMLSLLLQDREAAEMWVCGNSRSVEQVS